MNKEQIEISADEIKRMEANAVDYGEKSHDLYRSTLMASQISYFAGAKAEYLRHLKSLPDQPHETGLREEIAEYRKALNSVSTRLVAWELYGDDLNGGSEAHAIQKILDKYPASSPADKPEGKKAETKNRFIIRLKKRVEELERQLKSVASSSPNDKFSREQVSGVILNALDDEELLPLVSVQEWLDTKYPAAQPPAAPLGEADEAFELLSNVNQGLRDQISYLEEQLLNNSGTCRWVRASERLPDYGDDPWGHFKLNGKKVNGNFYDMPFGKAFKVQHHDGDYDVTEEDFDRLEWLDESPSTSK